MSRRTEEIPLMSPAPGTSRSLIVHRYGTPGAGPKAYIHAALHADEWPSVLVVQKLIPMLDAASETGDILGEIVVLPYANPTGLAQRMGGHVTGRYDYDGSGNFNRNWPDLSEAAAEKLGGSLPKDPAEAIQVVRAALRDAAAELPRRTRNQEWRAILLGLSIDADYVLDLHCDSEATLHTYTNVRHKDLVEVLGADLGAPVNLLEVEAGGGAFDEANAKPWWTIGDFLDGGADLPAACFGVTVELRGQADVLEEYADADAAALFRFLQRRGVIGGDPGPLPALKNPVTMLDAVDLVRVPRSGIVGYHKEVGDLVSKGDVVATLYDPSAVDPVGARLDLLAGTDGIMFSRFSDKLVEPGENVAKIAGTESLSYRKAGALLED
ncbi:succinylglutamate desuccinylase/aspartoacylase family protein [Hwanghaeella sp.]|uniref:succinylglutamate desuccinylase/aspartoacylase family protein n=1 Tax=Hwanghaeella sp. TaxID=2605943 RepID=UPI003CCBF068